MCTHRLARRSALWVVIFQFVGFGLLGALSEECPEYISCLPDADPCVGELTAEVTIDLRWLEFSFLFGAISGGVSLFDFCYMFCEYEVVAAYEEDPYTVTISDECPEDD